MNIRLYTPIYAITLLLSAALLFSVQPMFSKMVLPLLGGTPQVWNTAMLFFQATLLAGYAYAHGTSRYLRVPVQAGIHIALLLLFVVFLPLGLPEGWTPPTEEDPTLWQLGLMTICVGGPFFIISASAPMLQRWFAASPHPDAHNPYFLYGASNLGSMTALLSYPFVIDPLMGLSQQSMAWAIGYGGLIVMTALAALVVWKHAAKAPAPSKVKAAEKLDDAITWKLRLRWMFWAFIPSSMMLGVTTYVTTDIASAPLLWIVPLAIYVGSFIIVFSRREILSNKACTHLMFIALCFLLLSTIGLEHIVHNPFLFTGVHFLLFAITAIACHKRLTDLKPNASHLTEFYLLMSVGGVLGGFFNAIIAPQFFIDTIEYPIVIILACLVRYSWDKEQRLGVVFSSLKEKLSKNFFETVFTESNFIAVAVIVIGVIAHEFGNHILNILLAGIIFILLADSYKNRWVSTFLIVFLLCVFPPGAGKMLDDAKLIHQERNFFGVIRLIDMNGARMLLHGTTNHGVQALDEDYRLQPISYYGGPSPVNDIMDVFDERRGAQEFAVLGLGSGVTACYQKDGRHFDFFEIDPSIAEIAKNPEYFTFLSDCGSSYDVILGDGRLTIKDKPEGQYDFIFLDAFSSDSIPVHLLTLEAIEMYKSKLKPDGVLLFHISNRHLDLEPILSLAAERVDMLSLSMVSVASPVDDTELSYFPTHFVAFTNGEKNIASLRNVGWMDTQTVPGLKLWTDQYSDILSVFGAGTTKMRIHALQEKNRIQSELDAGRVPTSSP